MLLCHAAHDGLPASSLLPMLWHCLQSKVKVQFKEFKLLGLLPIKAPPSAQGELAITYLDDDLRISR